MQHADRGYPWPWAFLTSLQLLGRATACLPYGVPDPVLGEAAALALYTGGFGPITQIDIRAADARSLHAELMTLGFRRDECPTRTTAGLWHPQLEQGIVVIENCGALTPAERANVVTISLDAGSEHHVTMAVPRLRMIGVEDLIAKHIVRWLGEGAAYGEASVAIQMLLGLGRAGVSGRFRAGYLQRRLACETGGEVVVELPPGSAEAGMLEARTASLSEMAAVIGAWRARHGLAFDATPAVASVSRRHGRRRADLRHNEHPERRQAKVAPSNVIPFGRSPFGAPRMR